MNVTLRRIAVSTTATVALLGGAAATASATAPPEHEATVIAIAKAETPPGGTDGITNGLTPDNSGMGAQLQNPVTGRVPAGTNQQIQTKAGGGAIGAGVVAILLLGTVVFFRVKGNHIKAGDAVVVSLLGIALAGTVVGTMGDQLTDSVVSSLGNVLGGL